MIFRKPYAFLIKNFKKIHIFLLLICAFIFYKTMQLTGFVNEFLTYLSYDPYLEPITKYTSIFFYLACIIAIISSIVLLSLLRKKGKPWKLYIIPILTYLFLLCIFAYAQKYFATYEGGTSSTTARAIHDFIFIGTIPQYLVFVVLLIRVTGLDLNKFSFKNDKEYLELDQDDREEFEISVNIDKDAFKRTFRKAKRSIGYFYEEHRFICNFLITTGTIILVVYTYYYFAVAHKIVKESQTLNANGYSITVNKSYYSDKDKSGNILEKNSSFVILNVTITNNSSKRRLNSNNFHLINGREDYNFTNSTYSNNFNDIGNNYTSREFRSGEKRTYAMIFKVDKKLDKNNFVLYYQEYKSATKVYLRKIKLSLEDVSTIVSDNTKKVGEKVIFKYPNGTKKNMTFEETIIKNNSNYNIESCDSDGNCSITTKNIQTSSNYKILEIAFSSTSFEGEDFIDFSTNYGKIKYVDSENIAKEINIVDAMQEKDYLGKYIYIKVPNDIELAKSIEIIYTLRNRKYYFKIR